MQFIKFFCNLLIYFFVDFTYLYGNLRRSSSVCTTIFIPLAYNKTNRECYVPDSLSDNINKILKSPKDNNPVKLNTQMLYTGNPPHG